jgi:type IV pilus assembly protein PilM
VLNFLKSRNLVGLDIGNHTIKLVHLKSKGAKLALANLALRELPPEFLEESDPDIKNDLLSEAIKQLFKEHDLKTKDVVTSIPGDDVIVRYIKLPRMSEEELRNVITLETEQYIPLSIDQVVLDFSVLGELEEEGQKKLEVLLVAAKEEIVDRHLDLLARSGLNPVILDVDSFALSNAFEHNYGKIPGETISLINLGAKLTTINILEDGVSHLTRDVAVAGNNFTREIQQEFGISFAEAEVLKREQGQAQTETEDLITINAHGQDDKTARIGDAITPVLNKLLAEIRRSFDYYESSIRKKAVSRILLSGGAARLKNIDKFLSEKLNVPVEWNDPFKAIEISESLFDRDFIAANSPLFNVGLGLALRQVE